MAIAAGEIIAREACVPVGRVRSEVGIGHGQEVAPVPDKPAACVIRQGVDVGNGPNRGALFVFFLFFFLGRNWNREKRADCHRGREAYADEGHRNCFLPARAAAYERP